MSRFIVSLLSVFFILIFVVPNVQAQATLVQDIWSGSGHSYPSDLAVYNGNLYFRATDGTNGTELWQYDGSNASLVQDINTSGSSAPQYLTVYDGKLYFSNGTNGTELWQYDGSSASLVQDINTSSSSSPAELIVYDGKLYFMANDGTNGNELWRYTNIFHNADVTQTVSNATFSFNDGAEETSVDITFSGITSGANLQVESFSNLPTYVSGITGNISQYHWTITDPGIVWGGGTYEICFDLDYLPGHGINNPGTSTINLYNTTW